MTDLKSNVPRLHVTLCCHYLDPAAAVQKVRALMKEWGAADINVYSTNECHRMKEGTSATFQLIPNEWNDFSVYMKACRDIVLRTRADEMSDVYLFLNDTLLLRHPAKFLMRRLRKAVPTICDCEVPILVGRADPYGALLQTSPFASGLDRYISTFLFATNRAGILLLDRLFTSSETGAMIRSAAQLQSGELPAIFYAFLRLHLKAGDSRFAWQGIRTAGGMERKAVCVLLEHLVSAQFFREGFIFPINYNVVLEALLWGAYRFKNWMR